MNKCAMQKHTRNVNFQVISNPAGNGDWMVYMHLLREQLEFIETEASNFLRPLTFNYLRYLTASN
jgi:hypothetical protein